MATARRIVPGALAAALASPAFAQFSVPAESSVRERLTGPIIQADDFVPEAGDQVVIMWEGQAVGVQAFTSTDAFEEYSVIVNGDDPATTAVDGPAFNDTLQLRFFDASTDTLRTDLRLENAQGEPVTIRFRGEEVAPLPIDIPGLDLTPVRTFTLRLGEGLVNDGSGGDGSGGGLNLVEGDLDIDGNNRIETEDAALILRIVTGRATDVTDAQLARADVNRDGTVTTRDAVLVLRGRNSRASATFESARPQ